MSRRVEEQRRRVLLEHVRAACCTEGDDGAVRSLARGVAVRLGRLRVDKGAQDQFVNRQRASAQIVILAVPK